MADVNISVDVDGLLEAQAGLDSLNSSLKGLSPTSKTSNSALRDFSKQAEISGKRADKSFERVEQSASSLKSQVVSMRGVIAGLATGAAAAGVAKFVQSSVKQFATFEEGLLGVSKTTGITGQDLESLGSRITEMSKRIPVATKELLSIAQSAGQLGVEGSDNIEKFTETIAKLGTASDLQGERAAQSLARLITVTDESEENIDTLASVIVSLGNNFAATESQITKTANEVARSTTEFNLSSAEVSAFGAALTEAGARAEGAGTAIGRTFREINTVVLEGGQELQKMADLTGQSAEEFRKTWEQDALQGFLAFLQGVESSNRDLQVILDEFDLATEETIKVLGPLVSNTENLEQAMRLAGRETENATALNKEFSVFSKSLNAQLQTLSNTWNDVKRAVGDELQDNVREWNKNLQEFLDDEDRVRSIAGAIDILVTSIASFSETSAKVVVGFGNMVEAITTLAKKAGVIEFSDEIKNLRKLKEEAERLEEVRLQMGRLEEKTERLKKALERIDDPRIAEILRKELGRVEDRYDSLRETEEELIRTNKAIQLETIEVTGSLRKQVVTLDDINLSTLDWSRSVNKASKEQDKAKDSTREFTGAVKRQTGAIKRSFTETQEYRSSLRDVLRETNGVSTETQEFSNKLNVLSQAVERGDISAEQFQQSQTRLAQSFRESGKEATRTRDKMSEFAKQAQRNIQNELGNTLLKTMRGSFDGILDAWVRTLERMIAEAAARNIAEAVFSGGGGFGIPGMGGGSGGGILSGVTGMFGGGGGGSSVPSAGTNFLQKGFGGGSSAGAGGAGGAGGMGAAGPIAAATAANIVANRTIGSPEERNTAQSVLGRIPPFGVAMSAEEKVGDIAGGGPGGTAAKAGARALTAFSTFGFSEVARLFGGNLFGDDEGDKEFFQVRTGQTGRDTLASTRGPFGRITVPTAGEDISGERNERQFSASVTQQIKKLDQAIASRISESQRKIVQQRLEKTPIESPEFGEEAPRGAEGAVAEILRRRAEVSLGALGLQSEKLTASKPTEKSPGEIFQTTIKFLNQNIASTKERNLVAAKGTEVTNKLTQSEKSLTSARKEAMMEIESLRSDLRGSEEPKTEIRLEGNNIFGDSRDLRSLEKKLSGRSRRRAERQLID